MAWGVKVLLLHGQAAGSWTLDNPKQEKSKTGAYRKKNSSVKTKK